jgi:hypothetical protein
MLMQNAENLSVNQSLTSVMQRPYRHIRGGASFAPAKPGVA